jgi:hypothetical protein
LRVEAARNVGGSAASSAPDLKDVLSFDGNARGDEMIELKRISLDRLCIEEYSGFGILISIVHESHFGIPVQSGHERIPKIREESPDSR